VITPRKSLQRNWEEVKWCSQACGRAGIRAVDEDLEKAIITLLAARARGASICPSEAARHVRPENWSDLMEPARCAARRLHNAGTIMITQGGKRVDPSRAKGPIRLRLS
jgi:hypothetical protein